MASALALAVIRLMCCCHWWLYLLLLLDAPLPNQALTASWPQIRAGWEPRVGWFRQIALPELTLTISGAYTCGVDIPWGVLGNFWKTPFSEPLLRIFLRTLFIVKSIGSPFLRTLSQNLVRTILRSMWCRTTLRSGPKLQIYILHSENRI